MWLACACFLTGKKQALQCLFPSAVCQCAMKWLRIRSKKMWTALSLTMIALSLLLTLARHMLLAMLCFVSAAVILVLHTTTPAPTSLVHVSATIAGLCNLGLSFTSKCLGVLCLIVQAITSAFTTGMSAYHSSCSWNHRSRRSTWSLLQKSYSTARTPLSPRMLSAQYSDL